MISPTHTHPHVIKSIAPSLFWSASQSTSQHYHSLPLTPHTLMQAPKHFQDLFYRSFPITSASLVRHWTGSTNSIHSPPFASYATSFGPPQYHNTNKPLIVTTSPSNHFGVPEQNKKSLIKSSPSPGLRGRVLQSTKSMNKKPYKNRQ